VFWPFLTVYKGLENEYDFKTCCFSLLYSLSNNFVVFNKSFKALAACVSRTSAGVLYNLAMV
jgi:hypothetical protein